MSKLMNASTVTIVADFAAYACGYQTVALIFLGVMAGILGFLLAYQTSSSLNAKKEKLSAAQKQDILKKGYLWIETVGLLLLFLLFVGLPFGFFVPHFIVGYALYEETIIFA